MSCALCFTLLMRFQPHLTRSPLQTWFVCLPQGSRVGVAGSFLVLNCGAFMGLAARQACSHPKHVRNALRCGVRWLRGHWAAGTCQLRYSLMGPSSHTWPVIKGCHVWRMAVLTGFSKAKGRSNYINPAIQPVSVFLTGVCLSSSDPILLLPLIRGGNVPRPPLEA